MLDSIASLLFVVGIRITVTQPYCLRQRETRRACHRISREIAPSAKASAESLGASLERSAESLGARHERRRKENNVVSPIVWIQLRLHSFTIFAEFAFGEEKRCSPSYLRYEGEQRFSSPKANSAKTTQSEKNPKLI